MNLDISRLNLSEKDIEDYIYERPSTIQKTFHSTGLHVEVEHWIGRQYEVPSGIIDLIGKSYDNEFVVVEIKNGSIDGRAIAQVGRYAEDVERAIHVVDDAPWHPEPRVFKFVIGTSYPDSAIFECEAHHVIPLAFTASLKLDICSIAWKPEARKSIDEQRRELSERPEIATIFWEYRNGFDEMMDAVDEPEETDENA